MLNGMDLAREVGLPRQHAPQMYGFMHRMGYGNWVTVDDAVAIVTAWNNRSTKSTATAERRAARAELAERLS